MKSTATYLVPALALCAPLAGAADLQGAWLPKDTAWVVHIDVQKIVTSETFGHLKSEASARGEWQPDEWFDGEMNELGIDPFQDVKSVTLYGAGDNQDDGVVVLETSTKIDEVLELMRQEEEWSSSQHGGLEFDTFNNDGYLWVHHPDGDGNHVVFAAEDAGLLVQAVQTFLGNAPSAVGRKDSPLDLSPRPGTMAFMSASMDLSGIDGLDSMSHVTKLVSGFTAAVGEDRYGLFLDLSAQTASTEEAANLRRIVDGLRALVALAGDEVPAEALDLLDMIRIDVTGSQVSLSLSMPVQEIVQTLKAIEEEAENF